MNRPCVCRKTRHRGFLARQRDVSCAYEPPYARRDAQQISSSATTLPACTKAAKISMFYDPMIAKLCTHAPTRLEAIDAMEAALDEFRIEGIRHNIAFLNAIMCTIKRVSVQCHSQLAFIAEESTRKASTAAISTMQRASASSLPPLPSLRSRSRTSAFADLRQSLNDPHASVAKFYDRDERTDAYQLPTYLSRGGYAASSPSTEEAS